MNTFELPFAKVMRLDVSLAEIVVDEGVELDSDMVGRFHDFLVANFTPPIGILVNKINQYTYTFRAQLKLGDIPEVGAIGVVAYSQMSRRTTEAFSGLPRKLPLNLRIFDDRKRALLWLKEELHARQSTPSGVL